MFSRSKTNNFVYKLATSLVGEPITVPKVENPSSELIDQYHARFYDAFRQLFEKYKHDYSPVGSSDKLLIV